MAAGLGSIPRIRLCLSLFITKGVGSSSSTNGSDFTREGRDCGMVPPLEALPFLPDLSRSKAVGTGRLVSCPMTVYGDTGESLVGPRKRGPAIGSNTPSSMDSVSERRCKTGARIFIFGGTRGGDVGEKLTLLKYSLPGGLDNGDTDEPR